MNYQNLNSKLYPISQGSFNLDYDRENLIAYIVVDGFEEKDEIQLTQEDILDAAMGFNLIDSFYDPAYTDANFRPEIDGKDIDFADWWECVDPQDTERLIEGAITTKASMGLERTTRALFSKAVAA